MASPRQVLRVELTNLTDSRLTLRPQECTSILGNFAVRPETVTLEPGETALLDPMRGGVGASFDRLEITLVLASANRTEKQVVVAERGPANLKDP